MGSAFFISNIRWGSTRLGTTCERQEGQQVKSLQRLVNTFRGSRQASLAMRQAYEASQAQHSTAQHSTAQHGTAQHGTAQHSTAQHSTAQHSTAQHSPAQHSTAQHSIACRHSTAHHSKHGAAQCQNTNGQRNPAADLLCTPEGSPGTSETASGCVLCILS